MPRLCSLATSSCMGQSRYWRHSAARKKRIGRYKSVLEAKFAEDLEVKGIGFEYEPETLEYRTRVVRGVCDECNHTKVSQRRTYLPDFVVRRHVERGGVSSGLVYIETKGRLASADRTKMVAVKRDHPGLDIRLVFGSNNKLRKGSDKRYSDWASEHGFPFSIGARLCDEWSVELGCVRTGEPEANARRGRKARHRKGRGTPTPTGPSDPDSEGT